jgi:hypothetical protein
MYLFVLVIVALLAYEMTKKKKKNHLKKVVEYLNTFPHAGCWHLHVSD